MGARIWHIALLVGGCGRLGFDDLPPAPPPVVIDGEPPVVCATHPFEAVVIPDADIDLSVAVTPDGVTMGWVDRAGGPLYGLATANDWSVVTDPAGTMMKSGSWLSAAVGYVDGMVVASESETGSSVKLDTVQDLTSTEFGCPTANFAPKPPMLHAGPDTIAPTLFDNGLSVWPISGWMQGSATMTVPAVAAAGVAATQVGNLAEIVWSSDTTCYFETLTDAATATGFSTAVPCGSPRVASDGIALALVFESTRGVELVIGDPATIDPSTTQLLAAGARSPRITYDGARYWFSYLDSSDTLTVGYLDSQGEPRILTIPLDQSPQHDAFELAMVAGQPSLFATHHAATTLIAFEVCTP